MRHFFGFFLGLLLTPVTVVAGGWCLPRTADLVNTQSAFPKVDALVTIGVLSALAFLLALTLIPPRLTPLVPGMAGLGLAGLTAAHLLRPGLVDLVPGSWSIPGMPGSLTLLESGLLLPVALAMVVPLFWPSRWQNYRPRGAHAFTQGSGYDDDEGFGDLVDAHRDAA